MKYTYAYKTPDGTRHEETMSASSRDEVFSLLRKQGIRPIKVVAADGSKANGEVHGIRKRVVAVLLPLVALAVGVAAYLGGTRSVPTVTANNPASASPRHQIYGDPALVERFERGDFGEALPRLGDRLLACHAAPGKFMCPKGINLRRLAPADDAMFMRYAATELSADHDLKIDAEESREIRELKQIVNGIREEMRAYLANGNGTARSFWRRLNERTTEELNIYERTRRELENEKDQAVWEQKNDALRRLGLRTIPNAKDE